MSSPKLEFNDYNDVARELLKIYINIEKLSHTFPRSSVKSRWRQLFIGAFKSSFVDWLRAAWLTSFKKGALILRIVFF